MNPFELAPAQILLLKQPSKVKVNEILEATVQDLILRKIVRVEQIQSFPNPRSKKTQKYFMIKKGAMYEGYEPKNFENGLLAPLIEHETLMVKLVTDNILKKYSMPASFITNEIYKPLNREKYIGGLPILKAFGVYSLSSKCKDALHAIDQFVEQQSEKFKQNLTNQEEFYNILIETGWFVFIYKQTDNALFKEIVSMVKRIRRTQQLGRDKSVEEYLEAFDISFNHHE